MKTGKQLSLFDEADEQLKISSYCNNGLYCLCATCSNSVENCNVTVGESKEPCFACDECYYLNFEPEKKHMPYYTANCNNYIRDKYSRQRDIEKINREAERRRKQFSVIDGGKK